MGRHLNTITGNRIRQSAAVHTAIRIACVAVVFAFWLSHTGVQMLAHDATTQSVTLHVVPEAGQQGATAQILNSSDLTIHQEITLSPPLDFSFSLAAAAHGDDLPLVRFDAPAHLACFIRLQPVLQGGTVLLKAGDVNNDDVIDDMDIAAVSIASHSGPASGDINQDNEVDILDLIYIGQNFGARTGPCAVTLAPATAIPVPTLQPTATPQPSPTLTVTQPPQANFTPAPVLLAPPVYDNFDNGTTWIPAGSWAHDTQTSWAGNGWFANSALRDQSSVLTATYLIDLRSAQQPRLTFWQKMSLSSADIVAIDISLNGDVARQQIDAQHGAISDWMPHSVDLSMLRGQIVRLHFRLDTLEAVPDHQTTLGYWVDELAVVDVIPPTATIAPTENTEGPITATATFTQTCTPTTPATTATPTATDAASTATPQATPTVTPVMTVTTVSPVTATTTPMPLGTTSPAVTATSSVTATATLMASPTAAATITATATPTVMPSATPTIAMTESPTFTPTFTTVPTQTPHPTQPPTLPPTATPPPTATALVITPLPTSTPQP